MDNVKVSVLVYCYNHEKYLSQCIESILMQKTKFNYEIIIHDDASVDESEKIINKYVNLYPEKVKCFIENSSLFYNDPYTFFYSHMMKLAKGKYIALAEGDDFWIDCNKLQLQYEMMEKHVKCSLCVHNVQLLNCKNEKYMGVIPTKGMLHTRNNIVKSERILYRWIREGTFFSFNSYFIRRNTIEEKNVPKFIIQDYGIDFVKVLEAMEKGDILYIPSEMAVKRVYNIGSLSHQNSEKDWDKIIDSINNMIRTLEYFDEYSNHKYHMEIENVILYNEIKKKIISNKCFEKYNNIDFFSGKIINARNRMIIVIKNKVINKLTYNNLAYKWQLTRTQRRLKKVLEKYNSKQ